MALSVIIFDLDGTLIDSSVDICNAINVAISPHGLQPLTVRETLSLIGEGITRLFEKVIERNGGGLDRKALIARFLEHYQAHLVDNTTVYPEVRETLDKLVAYHKVVISNKRETLCRRAVEMLGMDHYFEFVVGSDTVMERKPSPLPLLYAVNRLGFRPDQAAMIGDSNYDIDSGKAAGMKTVAVTYGYRPASLLRGADFLIAEMPELLTLLECGCLD